MKTEQSDFSLIPDWSEIRKHYESLWTDNGKGVVIPQIQNLNPNPPEPEPWMIEASDKKYLDPERFYKLSCWRRTAWNWHADLFQYVLPSYGPNVFIGFCGGQPVFGADTVWHEPVMSSLDEVDEFHFDQDNYYWKIHLETVEYFVDKCTGEQLLGMTDFGGPTDWISALMGTENFMFACIEEPEKMRNLALRMVRQCNEAYDILCPMIGSRNDGSVIHLPVWSGGRFNIVQDDMAVNFSPQMYKDIFAPALAEQAAHTEHTALHWHDISACHLQTLLDIDEIDLIEYGPDPNSGPLRDKLKDMQAIQAAGKILFIVCEDSRDVKFFIDNLQPNGLIILIYTDNDDESREMQDNVKIWTEKRIMLLNNEIPCGNETT